jgi:predicted nucleic acid-binding protein
LAEPGRPLLLDTDVVSLLMRKHLDPTASGLTTYEWCVSFITVGELAKGAAMARWNLRRWNQLSEWLRHVVILPCDLRVAYTWGQLAGAAQQRGRPRPVNDMWIAAVSIANGIPLATRNTKDYLDFAEHHGLDLRTT